MFAPPELHSCWSRPSERALADMPERSVPARLARAAAAGCVGDFMTPRDGSPSLGGNIEMDT